MSGRDVVGSVLVVGGGVGGIQASLDLADSGYKVYLVESKPAIGGIMAQLDKTFPTNDCSMCILSPKLVDVGRHPNIELMTNASVSGIEGSAGRFRVRIDQMPRYVTEACVGCGLCAEACVLKGRLTNYFDEDMAERSAVYIPYPQAVPLRFIVDPEACLYLKHGKCAQNCIDACQANALDFEDTGNAVELDVGAIIMAPGYEKFDARLKGEYGYDRFENVVTSLEFERILSASGPFGGRVQRPSDGREPVKVAWIQCVGSRDQGCGNDYCSSVCCTYAIKEAVIAREHSPAIEPTIFYMDMRTFGKGFESYYNRAKDEHGIEFIRSRVSDVTEVDDGGLKIKYEDEAGDLHEEVYDLVVLSIGLEPSDAVRDLADRSGIELNTFGFCGTAPLNPMETNVEGIYVCGAFAGPKDIPETVIEASGAAGRASGLLSAERGSLVTSKEAPLEKDVSRDEPRIGVFVCHCGINIGAYVDVPNLVDYARTLPNVVFVEENLYTCSQDTQKKMAELIVEHDLNRVVVASCTPRTHEPLFQETLREAGLNPYLFEMANVRDQCSWVHMDMKDGATDKARDLLRMMVAKSAHLRPLEEIPIDLVKRALVIGGGLAGMTTALAVADQGFEAVLIESEPDLGGNTCSIHFTPDGTDVQKFLNDLIERVESNDLITVFKGSHVDSIDGFVGNFTTTIESGKEITAVEHGAIVVATGAVESKPAEYLFGEKDIETQLSLESRISSGEPFDGRTVVMIQCVGSREPDRPYCSRVCCTDAIKNAIAIKDRSPDAQVFVLYRDMRAYGFNEGYYSRARELGVMFIRFDLEGKPEVRRGPDGLEVQVRDELIGEDLVIDADVIALSPAIVPREGTGELAKMLKVPVNENGFFLEAHVKLRPVDFATEGIFLAGMAHSPKTMDESIAQAVAAASRVGALLSRGHVKANATISSVNEDLCIGCGLCVSMCPYKALTLELKEGGRKAHVITASCKGCGVCGASCPRLAITMHHFTNEELLAQIEAYRSEA